MEEKGFFASLFDISFTSFVTTKIIKVVYVLSMIVIGLYALFFIVAAFADSTALGLVVLLIGAPLGSLLTLIYTRMFLEFIVQVFRLNEQVRDQTELQRTAFANAGWLPSAAAAAPGTPGIDPSSPPPPPDRT